MSKSIKLNALYKTLTSFVNILFPLVTTPYVARILSVDGYTEYNRAASILAWFSPFAVFGVYTYGMRTISQIRENKTESSKLFSQLFSFNVATSSIVFTISVLLICVVPSFREYRLIYFLMNLQLLFNCFATDWFTEAFEDYGFILIKTFICKVLYVVSIFVLVRQSDDILEYVFITVFVNITNNFLTFIYAKAHTPFTKIHIQEQIKLIKPLFIVFLLVNSSMLYTIFDRFVLVWFGNKLQLTYYTISQALIMAITNVTSSVLLVTIPRLSNLWAKKNTDEYHKVLKKTSSAFLAVHTPCCIGIALLSKDIMWLYSGNNYIAGSLTLCCFAIRYYFSAFDAILAKQVLLATGNEKSLAKIYYTGGVYNILAKIALILTDNLTPELCVVTTATADVLVTILESIKVKKLEITYSLLSKQSIKYLLASLSFIPIVSGIKFLFESPAGWNIVFEIAISVFACSIVYAFVLIVTKDNLLLAIPFINKFLKKKHHPDSHISQE